MRVPPSRTYSADTPAPRLPTSSRNAGGKDPSRPTSRPTFSAMGGPSAASLVPVALRHALQPAERLRDRLPPPGPELRRRVGPVRAGVVRLEVLLVPLAHGRRPGRHGAVALAQHGEHVDAGH